MAESFSSTRAYSFLFAILSCQSLLTACSDESPADACTKDSDCKGTRICEDGTCIDPPNSTGTGGSGGEGSGGVNTTTGETTSGTSGVMADGYYAGVWSDDAGGPSFVVFDLRDLAGTFTGSAQSQNPVVGVTQDFSAQGDVANDGKFTLNLFSPTIGCMAQVTGDNRDLIGTVSESGLMFTWSGASCGFMFLNGTGSAKRSTIMPNTPHLGVTGFYSGWWLDYPSPGSDGGELAVGLTQSGNTVTGTLHTLSPSGELYLSGTGTVDSQGFIDLDLSGNDTCPTSFHLTGYGGEELAGSIDGNDCEGPLPDFHFQSYRHK